MENIKDFKATFDYKLIYVFRINDGEHTGCLKIGDATIHTNKNYTELDNNCHELNDAAKKRIDSYTSTAAIKYELLHTEIAVYKNNDKKSGKYGKVLAFRDHNVHDVLKRSGIKAKKFELNRIPNEWFVTDLETVKKAIKCVKDNKTSLDNKDITKGHNPIIFRPEQEEAIKKTIQRFKSDNSMLWNAKMRFGKTLSALQVVKEMEFKKTIIVTHRPVVDKGWYEDFSKIFYDMKDKYEYGSRDNGKKISELLKSSKSYVYFASMQDLRESKYIGGKYDKNKEIFTNDWDFIIIDEAHEGTKTDLGQKVLEAIVNNNGDKKTYALNLSGTPFNLITDFEKDSIYTWDYIMEQEAKLEWDKYHFGDSNPYAELPRMNIFTYHLEKNLPAYIDVEDKAFNFKEFFRVWTGDKNKDKGDIPNTAKIGEFVHENDIVAFLNLICKKDEKTNYPFSTDAYRDFFRHSLWCVPGVAEAKALEKLLNAHKAFKEFEIVNVAGDGGEDTDTKNPLDAVKEKMTDHPEDTYTITLSCGRLTTGVSVPEWTSVLMLYGSYNTAASQYLQTIFRVQTPANINGRMKEECYVFDFAPDRTLKMIAESVQLSASSGSNNPVAELALKKFLNFCPVISIDQSQMKEYKVSQLLQELKKAYADRVARNGFDDPKIYNDELLKLTEVELKEFEKLKKIVGDSKQTKKSGNININDEGFTQEEYDKIKKIERKKKRELTEEEKRKLEEFKEKKKNRATAISILRAISIRMPLLVYGMDIDIDEDITIDNFASKIDDASWKEFMPDKVTKEVFSNFTKYYDKDIFVAASRRIRYIAKTSDELEPFERVKKISELFSSFKNPDKETVLTPWRVVNMHLGNTIGGYNFFDEKYENLLEIPRFVSVKNATSQIFNLDSKILEINSKTGLYPLYMVYSLYMEALKKVQSKELTNEQKYKIWDRVVLDQLFIVCKTPMAKAITQRTLIGYRTTKINAHSFDDLVMQLKEKNEKFVDKVLSYRFWNLKGVGKMKFNAIVGNPPYQLKINNNEEQQNATSIYHLFMQTSLKLMPDYISLIMPSRWMTGGRGLDEFRKQMLETNTFEIIHDHLDARDCFANVEIKGGVCYFLSNPLYNGKCDYYLHADNKVMHSVRKLDELNIGMAIRDYRAIDIIKKVIKSKDFESFESIAGSQTPFGIVTSFKDYTETPTKKNTMKIYGNKFVGYTSPKNIIKNEELAYRYKVFVPKAIGDGIITTDRIKPIVPDNPSICTQTYIIYGAFDSKKEAENLSKYMQTKFFHFLLGQLKNTQQMSPNMFKLVPLVDFKETWNDEKLYKRYKLTSDEIEFIESIVWS